jgi:hypothetical protein
MRVSTSVEVKPFHGVSLEPYEINPLDCEEVFFIDYLHQNHFDAQDYEEMGK